MEQIHLAFQVLYLSNHIVYSIQSRSWLVWLPRLSSKVIRGRLNGTKLSFDVSLRSAKDLPVRFIRNLREDMNLCELRKKRGELLLRMVAQEEEHLQHWFCYSSWRVAGKASERLCVYAVHVLTIHVGHVHTNFNLSGFEVWTCTWHPLAASHYGTMHYHCLDKQHCPSSPYKMRQDSSITLQLSCDLDFDQNTIFSGSLHI